MSDHDKNQDNDKEVDPIEQVLTIETPVVNDSVGNKKKKPSIAKYGMYAFVGAVVVLAGSQMFFGGPPPKANNGGAVAQVRTSDAQTFVPSPASTAPTNSEASELANKKEAERAAEASKDPSKSFISQDPFGSGSTPVVQEKENLPPPPPPVSTAVAVQSTPPPIQPVSSGNQQEDPALTYARKLFASAQISPKMGLSAPPVNQNANAAATGGMQNTSATGATGPLVKDASVAAGEIKYAVLTSGLNTLVPQTPARAIIHGGILDGSVLLGSMENANDQYMVLRFKTLTIGKKTYPIEAIAVNQDMQDAGLADEVKSHLLEKTAIQAGVGFVQSFGAAKLQEGTTTSSSVGANGSTSFTQTPNRTNKQTAMIALGGAAQAITPAIDQAVSNIRPEVIIHPNKEMGILFLKPLFLQ